MPGYMDADERHQRAVARTTTPTGGYKVAPQPEPQPAPAAAAPKQVSTLANRLNTERELGMVRGNGATGKLFGARNHSTGILE